MGQISAAKPLSPTEPSRCEGMYWYLVNLRNFGSATYHAGTVDYVVFRTNMEVEALSEL